MGVWWNGIYGKMSEMRFLPLLLASVCLPVSAATNGFIRTAAELYTAVYEDEAVGREFDFDALMVTDCSRGRGITFSVQDDTGYMALRKEYVVWSNLVVAAGSKVHVYGIIDRIEGVSRRVYARCRTISVIGQGTPPKPVTVSAVDLLGGHYDCQLVNVRGTVRDIVVDEVDIHYLYMVVDCDGQLLYIPCASRGRDGRTPDIGAEILVTGCCLPDPVNGRKVIGRLLSPIANGIRTLKHPSGDLFDVPAFGRFGRMLPQDIATLGRRKLRGQVIAVWQGDTALVRTADGEVSRVEFAVPAPRFGSAIEVVGFPESDLYFVNLSRSIWRPTDEPAAPPDLPKDRSVDALQAGTGGHMRFVLDAHGKAIRLEGVVRNLPGSRSRDGRFNLESGGYIVPVDVSSVPDAIDGIDVGYGISVAGTCVMNSENWRPNNPLPQIKGFTLVVRTPDDIRIVSRPPWWTPGRLLAVIGSLLAILAAIFAWNVSLRRLVERRGRELAEETVSRVTADLKVYERTHLAVELHDSIAQNLTGVALEINTANRTVGMDPVKAQRHLDIAAKSLKSCRDELRYCLWDLRNSTLESADMEEAIRQTLAPHIGETALSVRFSVPRIRISDNTAHAILRIVRELSVNAIRHGGATSLRVAGSVEGEKLLFSVRDNGCGFDPANCPGVTQGHYGLLGIRERVESFEGEVRIDSAPGRGTKVTIALNVPQESTKENPS